MSRGNRTPPAPTEYPWGTCDWGNCDEESVAWRWAGQRLAESPLGWLPVCERHARSGRVEHREARTP